MKKYVYPAVFTPEENGSFSITYPDLEGCHTCGNSLEDGIEMAGDALSLTIYGYETDGREIPDPSNPAMFNLSNGAFIKYIVCSLPEFKK